MQGRLDLLVLEFGDVAEVLVINHGYENANVALPVQGFADQTPDVLLFVQVGNHAAKPFLGDVEPG